MATNCIFNDYVRRRRSSLLFGDDSFRLIVDKWHKDDPMLIEIQSISFFKGLTKWSQLDPAHFRVLIINSLNKRDKTVASEKHFDDREQVVSTLYLLIMGLIYCVQARTGGAVDALKLTRISEQEITFEFALTMMQEYKKPKPDGGLRVIVDNTDNENNN